MLKQSTFFIVFFFCCTALLAESPFPENVRYGKLDPYLAWDFPETMRVEVRRKESSSERISDATVRLKLESPDGKTVFEKEFRTGEDGTVDIPLAEQQGKSFRSFYLEVNANSLAPAAFLRTDVWQAARSDPYRRQTQDAPVRIPRHLTVELKDGVMLPLEFVDNDGKPVEDAGVVVWFGSGAEYYDGGGHLHMEKSPRMEFRAKTDAEGKCLVGPVDRDFVALPIHVSCSGYRDFHGHIQKQSEGSPPGSTEPEPLRFRFTLQPTVLPGEIFVLEGRILDPDGKPIAGAILSPSGISDENGHYRTELQIRDGKVDFLALAPGMKRNAFSLDPKAVVIPFDITLQPGRPIRIRAEDEQGNPIPEIAAYPVIQDISGLYGHVFRDDVHGSYWETCDVPNDEVYLAVYYVGKSKDGKTYRSEKPYCVCRARSEPYTVRMTAADAPPPKPELSEEFLFSSGAFVAPRIVKSTDHSWKLPDRTAFRIRDFETGNLCEDVQLTVTLSVRTDLPKPGIIGISSISPSGVNDIRFALPETKTDSRGVVGVDFTEFDSDAVLGASFLFERKGFLPKRLDWRSGDIGPIFYSGITPASQLRRVGPELPEFFDLVLVPQSESNE